jgi:HEAT repeat protein
VLALPTRQNIGYFLKPLTRAAQVDLVVDVLHGAWGSCCKMGAREPYRLTRAQLQKILREIEASGNRLPLKVMRKNLDDALLSKGTFLKDGVWRAEFATIESAWVVQYTYAIDGHSPVVCSCRVLVEGPRPKDTWTGRRLRDTAEFVPPEPSEELKTYFRCCDLLSVAAYLDEWRAGLAGPDAVGREYAAFELGQHLDAARESVPELTRAVRDPARCVRAAAARTLSGVALAAFATGAPPARAEAAQLLGRLGREVPDSAFRRLQEARADESPGVRRAAAAALATIGRDTRAQDDAAAARPFEPLPRDGVPDLRKELVGGDPQASLQAVGKLAAMGPAARDALPELRKMLGEEEPAYLSAMVIRRIGAAAWPAVPDLRKALRAGWRSAPLHVAGSSTLARVAIVEALGGIGPAARDAVDDLRWALSDPSCEVRRAAARALTRIGAAAHGADADLRKALNDRDEAVREAARAAIKAIGA